MLARAHRLTSGRAFTDAVRRGRRAGRQTVVLHLAAAVDDADSPPRVGFVVGKAVGGAVLRNEVRRRLRHVTRQRVPSLPHGSVLVVRAQAAAAGRSSAELAADVDAALRRLLDQRP